MVVLVRSSLGVFPAALINIQAASERRLRRESTDHVQSAWRRRRIRTFKPRNSLCVSRLRKGSVLEASPEDIPFAVAFIRMKVLVVCGVDSGPFNEVTVFVSHGSVVEVMVDLITVHLAGWWQQVVSHPSFTPVVYSRNADTPKTATVIKTGVTPAGRRARTPQPL
ncbi:hypothetical protein E2C01_019595 [Portunus trituberculatus]|uniref:Uncharacterized protein n=1 Tax=Portunus trituberculatus TaxID=210409 RepID=A0A5B7DZE4_PORTR|nr:hypothetical protein [Portunus trituberculatus]